jgi:hypothetical protein
MGVRQIREIHALSNSTELATWDLPGDYSRPICRRIVEAAGVPRESFGMSKKASTNLFRQGEATLTEQTRAAYHQWLRDCRHDWRVGGGKEPELPSRPLLGLWERYYLADRLFLALQRFLPGNAAAWVARKSTELRRWLNRRINLVPHLFPWAVEKVSDAYRSTKDVSVDAF